MLSSNMAMKIVYGLKIFVDHTLKNKANRAQKIQKMNCEKNYGNYL